MKKTAVFICGPTAVGKTSVAIEIAKWLKTEIISFDSRQFFDELKIGSAPPSPEELSQVKHHLVGQLSITDEYNAGGFEKDALTYLNAIFKKNDVAVLVGGSGLYMKALTDGFDDMPEVDPKIRVDLNALFEEEGIEALQKKLAEKDPEYYTKSDIQNPQRLIRALEVIESTGEPYSKYRTASKIKRDFNIVKLGLNMEREKLYERINLRVDQMLSNGLEEEVKSLLNFRKANALQTVGYKEFFAHFDGEISKEFAIEEIKKNSRRYAKRQLTWFRRDEEIKWFSPFEIDEVKTHLLENLQLAKI